MFRFSLGHEPSLLDIEDGAPVVKTARSLEEATKI